MIVSWKGLTWGARGSSTTVTRCIGIEDIARRAANPSGGTDGAVAAPSFFDVGSFVLELFVQPGPLSTMKAELDSIRAATWGDQDLTAEDPFDFTVADEDQRTIFARVVNRKIPTDLTTEERENGVDLLIGFEATDAMVYGPEVTVTGLEIGDSVEIEAGWAPSKRWRWIAHGEATNPRLTLATPGYPNQILRLVGTANPGQNLLVESTPDKIITTVGGFNRYSDFDGGVQTIAARWFRLLEGQTVTYSAVPGAGDASFRYWPAVP